MMSINEEIIQLRNRLDCLVTEEYSKTEIIKLSQDLDILIQKYMEEKLIKEKSL